MSKNNRLNEDINNEEEIIVNLMSEIFQYENKIKEINNLLMNNNTVMNRNYIDISNLKKQKIIYQEKISELEQKISEKIKIKEEQIKSKESIRNEIENKIQEFKYQLNTFNVLKFNSIISQEILNNKNSKNDILTNEQINELLLKIKKSKDNINEINDRQNNEIINYNKKKENDIINNIKDINMKINQIDERLKMLKEDKQTINNELINIISCKESIDALIKFNHYLIKNYQEIKENITNKNNNEVKIDEEKYKKNKWNSSINLYFYELNIIDIEKFSHDFNEIIFDLFNLNDNNKNNSNINSKNGISLKENNSFEDIIKKEFYSSLKNIQNGIGKYNKNIFLKSISYKIVNNLITFLNLYKENNNINEINQNITIYLSYFIKSLYYEKIIGENLKFINKEYKYNKKELQKIISELTNEKKKQEIIKMDIQEKIDNNKKDIKLINNESIKNRLLNNFSEQTNKLSKDENDYLQICYNINNLTLQKKEILSDSETILSEFNIQIKELNLEKNEILKELEEIEKKITDISNILEQRTLKANNEIIEYRKMIAGKYNNIKAHLKKCKIKYGHNTDVYNSLLTSINDSIHRKNKDIFDINDLNSIKLTSSHDNYYIREINSENLSKNSFHSSYDGKGKYKPNIYASNKIKKHINYYNKYFNLNISKEKEPQEKEAKKHNLKSFSQINFYKGLYNNQSLNKNSKNRNVNIIKSDKINKINTLNSSNTTSFIDKYAQNLLNAFTHKRSQYNSVNISRSINSFKNNNINKSFNYNKKEKIDNIQNYKTTNYKIHHQKPVIPNYPSEISQKLKPLLNITFCYLRKIESKIYHKYDPIQIIVNSIPKKSSTDSLTKSPYNFTKATISLDKSYNTLRIVLTSQLDPIDINIKDIKYTTIRTKIKIISEIYRDYKKFTINGNENFQKDLFIKKEMEKYKNLSYEYVNKCLENNKFNLMIYLENGKLIEFVFCSYEEFKTWVNGFALLIKAKDKLIKMEGE